MDPLLQDYPRKRARLRRANDGFWTPGMGEPTALSTSVASQATSIHSSPFAAPSPARQLKASIIRVNAPVQLNARARSPISLRLNPRGLPDDPEPSSISITGADTAAPQGPQSQPKTTSISRHVPSSSRAAPQEAPANSSPKAKAVVGDSSSPFWSNAGGIFQPDAQNPIPIISADASALPQLPKPVGSSAPNSNSPSFAGISALVFDPTENQPTSALLPAPPPSSPSPTTRRTPASLSSPNTVSLSVSRSRSTNPFTSLPSAAPSTVTETRSTIATSSSLLLTTAIVSASQSSVIPTSSSSIQSSSSSASAASASASSTNFFSTLGSSAVNITITVLVCVGILALIIAFLFIFIRRCQRRRKKRRLGDILGSEFGSPGGNGGSGMSEWATPGPGWTEKYYGEQIGGRMLGSMGHGGGGRTSSNGHGDEVEYWQRDFAGAGVGMGMEGGYGVARTLSQGRRTSEWANYRNAENEFDRRPSWEEVDDGGIADQTHVLEYGSNNYAAPAPPPAAAIRPRSEPDFALLAPPSTTRSRPQPVPSHSYSSYASESMYPVDEVGDIEAEKKELSETMSALNLGGVGQRNDNSASPPSQTSWRDSLDWVMGSAADLIGSKLLARHGSADTLVASPPKKDNKEDDRFTQRPPSIRIPRVDPLTISDQFTPLSPSYGDRFLNPSRAAPAPPTLSRQSSMTSLTSSANFATTNQQGTFAQSARSRLFDASVAKHAQDEDEMEILDDLAATMMSREPTNITNSSEIPPSLPEIPYPRFDPTPLSISRRFVSSPVDMSRTSSASTSSSFTYRATPPQDPFLTPPEMLQGMSTSSMGSQESLNTFGQDRRHHQLSLSRQRTLSQKKRKEKKALAMEPAQSLTSISTFEDNDVDYWTSVTNRERDAKASELIGERRRRSREFEESLV